MQRREFIAAIGSAAASSAIWPEAAGAQSAERVRRIGILVGSMENTEAAHALLGPFRDSLSNRGWAEGRNLRIDLRVSGDDAGRVRADAGELASLAPDLIVAISGDATRALQLQTHVIPIVFIGAVDVDETGSVVKKTRRPKRLHTDIPLPLSVTSMLPLRPEQRGLRHWRISRLTHSLSTCCHTLHTRQLKSGLTGDAIRGRRPDLRGIISARTHYAIRYSCHFRAHAGAQVYDAPDVCNLRDGTGKLTVLGACQVDPPAKLQRNGLWARCRCSRLARLIWQAVALWGTGEGAEADSLRG
jgi:hypothetical protein